MQQLHQGTYYGKHKQELDFNQFLLTDTIYTHEKVDWHYHENPYFTFLLNGKLFEANNKESYVLEPGSLLFHHWQDAHYNIKPPEYTRGFHIELTKQWFTSFNLPSMHAEGSIHIENPLLKQNIYKIYLETKTKTEFSKTSIEILLLNTLCAIENDIAKLDKNRPKWVDEIIAILHEQPELCKSLSLLASQLNVHPVHISREFPKYFKTSISDYVKCLRLNKALSLMADQNKSLTETALEAGFYDQSHFIKSFKQIFNTTPLAFQKKFANVNNLQF